MNFFLASPYSDHVGSAKLFLGAWRALVSWPMNPCRYQLHKPATQKRTIYVAAISLAVVFATWVMSIWLQPRILTAHMSSEANGSTIIQPMDYPYSHNSGSTPVKKRIELMLDVPLIAPTFYSISVDDCVDWIRINGATVSDSNLPYCNYLRPLELELAPYLKKGANVIDFGYRNHGGPGRLLMQIGAKDTLYRYLKGLQSIALSIFFFLVAARLYRSTGKNFWIAGAFALGTFLRIFYLHVTPYDLRAYDVEGHLEYIKRLTEALQIPRTDSGWQTYQPPLYYLLASFVYRLSMTLGANSEVSLHAVQALSACISITFLYLAIICLTKLPLPATQKALISFGPFIIATLPALVFTASHINNGPLAHVLGLAAFILLYQWWQTGDKRTWLYAVLALCLAMITKATALTLTPVFMLCLLYARHTPFRAKLWLIAVSSVMFFALVGWYVFFRLYIDHQGQLVGNIKGLSHLLRVDAGMTNFIIYNPIQILAHPYNNPWSDTERRSYLWEFLTRSVLFGEFHFGESLRLLAQSLLIFLFLAIGIILRGLLVCFSRLWLPMHLLFLSQLIAISTYRALYPFSCNQDFRFILLAAIPGAFFFVRGALETSRFWLITCAMVCTGLVGASSYFILSL